MSLGKIIFHHILVHSSPSFFSNVVGDYLRRTEPEKVAQRKGRRFKRKRYYAAGVNDVWPQDQHDKWGPRFGLWFHCSLDAYTGYLNWLKVWWTNKNPRLIAKFYLDCCRKMKGTLLLL